MTKNTTENELHLLTLRQGKRAWSQINRMRRQMRESGSSLHIVLYPRGRGKHEKGVRTSESIAIYVSGRQRRQW
jgi:hypothetical protein